MTEYPVSKYVRELRNNVPAEMMAPAPSRVLWLLLHVGVIAGGILLIGSHLLSWPLMLALSLVIGHSFAGTAFVAHEALHGAIVRNRRLRLIIGGIGFLPFSVSPSLWVAWHNRVHHNHTGEVGVDPDSYPMLDRYRVSKTVRFADAVSFGARRLLGWFTLLIGFTGMSLVALSQSKDGLGMPAAQRRIAMAHTFAAMAMWTAIGFAVGAPGFLFACVIPLFIGNTIVMSYILTNHSLSPLTKVNDPLINSLSVTVPRIVDVLHLSFGFHVEHHLFPAMSPRHARKLRALIVERWPERYQTLPLLEAMTRLYKSPRIYEDATTLINPVTGHRVTTLLPGTGHALPIADDDAANDDAMALPIARKFAQP